MYYLLTTPLKKVKKSINQLYIFFKVTGTVFDDIKEDIQTVLNETNIITASEKMLPVFGEERELTRYYIESIEEYRTKLTMKAILAAEAGTKKGVQLAVKSLGYENVQLIPMYIIDPTRWAEFLIEISMDIDDEKLIVLPIIQSVVRKMKQASAKDNYSIIHNVPVEYSSSLGMMLDFKYSVEWWNYIKLAGGTLLDGSTDLSSARGNYNSYISYNYENEMEYTLAASVYSKKFLSFLDGTYSLDGSINLNANEELEVLE